MPTSTTSPSKKKRLLTAVAIFTLPALVLVVAVAALVKGHAKTTAKPSTSSAFNTSMPTPNLPKGEKNKLEIYMQAQQDSIKQRQERAKDPYVGSLPGYDTAALPGKTIPSPALSSHSPLAGSSTPLPFDENEKKVTERLQKIYAALGAAQNTPTAERPGETLAESPASLAPSADVPRLEKLIASLHQKDTGTDPRLRQIKEVLDQVIALKYPERTSPATPSEQDRSVLPVEATPTSGTEFPEKVSDRPVSNGFFGLSDEIDSSTAASTSLQAVIHNTQTVQTGSIVKLRLLQPIFVGGQEIPANAFIYGPATITGERVTIQLTNAIYNGRIFPIALKVYDGTDGLEGLFVPGMITRDVVKQNMSQGVSGLNIATLDPSLGAQAAAAGIETARNLLSRKINLVKATLKAGHIAILKRADNH